MPSGWEVYYVVFLSAILALSIPAALAMLAYLLSPKRSSREPAALEVVINQDFPSLPGLEEDTPAPSDSLGRRINTRFFLGANAAMILIVFPLALIPCVGTLSSAGSTAGGRGLVAIVTLALFAALGLLYAARKGDLDWLKSHRKEGGE